MIQSNPKRCDASMSTALRRKQLIQTIERTKSAKYRQYATNVASTLLQTTVCGFGCSTLFPCIIYTGANAGGPQPTLILNGNGPGPFLNGGGANSILSC